MWFDYEIKINVDQIADKMDASESEHSFDEIG